MQNSNASNKNRRSHPSAERAPQARLAKIDRAEDRSVKRMSTSVAGSEADDGESRPSVQEAVQSEDNAFFRDCFFFRKILLIFCWTSALRPILADSGFQSRKSNARKRRNSSERKLQNLRRKPKCKVRHYKRRPEAKQKASYSDFGFKFHFGIMKDMKKRRTDNEKSRSGL